MNGVLERLERILADEGITGRARNSALSEICGVHYETARLWMTGSTKTIPTPHLEAIAKRFKINIEWLRFGKGPMKASEAAKETSPTVPLYTWDVIDEWVEADPIGRINTYGQELSEKAFAVQYFGDAMTGFKGQNVPDKSILIVDPNKEPVYGLPILAWNDDGALILGNYAKSGSDVALHAANTNYPTTLLKKGKIVGTVVLVLNFLHPIHN